MKKLIAQFRNGFTLAEVLITLVIIGVVAALTIPTVINNTKDRELRTQFRKSYSVISQALNSTEMNDFSGYAGCYFNDFSQTNGINWVYSECQNFYDAFFKRIQVQKVCRGNSKSDGCVPSYQTYNTVPACQAFNQNYIDNVNFSYVLADGQIMNIYVETDRIYPLFLVDINGHKGPNAYGKDLFSFSILKDNVTNNIYLTGDGLNSCSFPVTGGRTTKEMMQYALVK